MGLVGVLPVMMVVRVGGPIGSTLTQESVKRTTMMRVLVMTMMMICGPHPTRRRTTSWTSSSSGASSRRAPRTRCDACLPLFRYME
jgi:fructose-specific phosphotransferase system IIC component